MITQTKLDKQKISSAFAFWAQLRLFGAAIFLYGWTAEVLSIKKNVYAYTRLRFIVFNIFVFKVQPRMTLGSTIVK